MVFGKEGVEVETVLSATAGVTGGRLDEGFFDGWLLIKGFPEIIGKNPVAGLDISFGIKGIFFVLEMKGHNLHETHSTGSRS